MMSRSTCVLFLAGCIGSASGQATYPRGGLWIFGDHGLNIYSIDGARLLKSTPPEDFCPLDTDGQPQCRSYHEIVSDFNKYAWTTADSRSGTNVEIFDLNNGDFVGSFPTCTGARGFTFLPERRELWFRCTSPHTGDPDGESGYWDSFSTTSISTHFPEISLKLDFPHDEATSYGQPVFLEERGVGYSSDYTNGVVHKVDLNAREPLANITVPLANGGWDMGYSPLNEHIFMKTYVCCTCGGPDKDLENCVEYRGGVHADPVFVLTGPSANQFETQIGACGRHCDNSLADVLGVVEIDTRSDSIVGYHKNHIGLGASDVHVSPDGKYIVLVSTPGATPNIRLLKPGANGQPSTFYRDTPLPTEGRLGEHAFITSDVIATTTSDDNNHLYLIEISAGTVHTIKLDTSGVNTDNGRGRLMNYPPGSSILWIGATGPQSDVDAYVVELDFNDWSQSKVARKVEGVDVNGMLFVENMILARDHSERNDWMDHATSTRSRVESLEQEVDNLRATLGTTGSGSGGGSSSIDRASVISEDSNDTTKAVSIAALVMGCFALLVAIAGLVTKKPARAVTTAAGSKDDTDIERNEDKASIEKNEDKNNEVTSEYSMGSKRDNYA